MRQQINLYQPALREEPQLLGARTALAVLAAVVIALTAIWGYGTYKVHRLEQSAQTLRQEQEKQNQALAIAGTFSASRATPAELEARVRQTEAEVVGRTRALALLRAGALGRTTGFADRLEALARRHLDGVWIDRMALSGATGSMSLGGATFDPNLVPRYLQNLGQESVLAGARFDELVIDRPAGKKGEGSQVRFRASSLAVPTPPTESDEKGAT
jgi:Tfp pilus assembly protein PilN